MKSRSIMRRFIRELLHPRNAFLFISWVLFTVIWFWGWNDDAIFDSGWWFDAVGHALFGFLGALTFFYLFRRYAVRGIFNIAGDFFLALIIVSVVTCFGVLWEAVELGYDLAIQPSFADWLVKAQKNSVDTTIDILENIGFSILAMLAAATYRALYRRRYPDESEQEEIEEMRAKIEHFSRELRGRHRKHLFYFRSHLKNLIRAFRNPLSKQ